MRSTLDGTPFGRQHPNAGLGWLIVVLIITATYLPYTSGADFSGFVADDAVYLLMADYFSGVYADEPMLHYLRSVSHLPPLYSLLLASVGGVSAQIDVAHVVQTLILISAALTWGRVARRISGDQLTGLLTLLALAALPATMLYSAEIWSEFLYLLLLGLAVLMIEQTDRLAVMWLPAALLLGLAAITRGFGLVAIIALIIIVALRARRLLLPVTVLALAPVVAAHILELGGGLDYLEIFRSRVPDVGALPNYVTQNLAALGTATQHLLAPTASAVTAILCMVLLLPVMSAFVQRLRAQRFDALYALGYLTLLVLWPFPEAVDRLVYPLAPLLIIYAALGCSAWGALINARLRDLALPAPALLIVFVALMHSLPMAWRFSQEPLPGELEPWRASRYWLTAATPAAGLEDLTVKQAMVTLMRHAREHVPANGCIYAFHPQAAMYYARRASWPAPTGAARPDEPDCRYHILLSNDDIAASAAALWANYDILETATVDNGIAAILIRYPP